MACGGFAAEFCLLNNSYADPESLAQLRRSFVRGTGFVVFLHLTGAIRVIFKHLRPSESCSLVIREYLALFDLSACGTQFYTHERLWREGAGCSSQMRSISPTSPAPSVRDGSRPSGGSGDGQLSGYEVGGKWRERELEEPRYPARRRLIRVVTNRLQLTVVPHPNVHFALTILEINMIGVDAC